MGSSYTWQSYELWWLARNNYLGLIKKAIKGKRGQKFLRDLLAALEAMPKKELDASDALDILAAKRGINLETIDFEDMQALGAAFGVAPCLVAEVSHVSQDESRLGGSWLTPEELWVKTHTWVTEQLS